jgi:(S)-2-hydroxyglutarate dehydrogenase
MAAQGQHALVEPSPELTGDRSEAWPARADVVVIGAGIVGLATARAVQLRAPGLTVVVVDKEPRLAAHQSSHNSGVVHAGLYYRPGSDKARLCQSGRAELLDWCDRHQVPWRRCGKVVVATDAGQLARLEDLAERAAANHLEVHRLGPAGLADLEPHAAGVAALHVPATAVIDFAAVCQALARDIRGRGGVIVLGQPVTGIERRVDGLVVHTPVGSWPVARVANCAGLQSDRVARAAGDRPASSIMAFRGEYHELVAGRRHLVRALIYPVPDPRFPFLGVHLTRGLDGTVHAGPNAVLALSRQGYGRRDIRIADVAALAADPATWRLARRYWRTGAAEVARSMSRRALARSLQRLVPEVSHHDLVPAGSGVRAQAVAPDGTLVDDFVFTGHETRPNGRPAATALVHVVNAPSPAATASLAIGHVVAARLLGQASEPTGAPPIG